MLLKKLLHIIKSLLSHSIYKIMPNKLVTFKNYHKDINVNFYIYKKCPISSSIKNNTFWEKHLHDVFEKFINENSIVIEGGCHIGSHTIKMALMCKHIYAFEPFPKSYDLLKKNIEINKLENVSLIKKGLSNTSNTVQFGWIPSKNPGGSGLSDNPMGQPKWINNSEEKIDVQLTTIDMLDLKNLDFIKLDVEGYEELVIKGGLKTIKNFKPVITLESWSDHNGQVNINHTKEKFSNLIELGYKLIHLSGPDFLFIIQR